MIDGFAINTRDSPSARERDMSEGLGGRVKRIVQD